MKLLRKILFPMVPIYYAITWCRNILYDFGLKKSTSFDLPVICVGNLSVGGTGKTPMIEYLIRLLKDDYKVATLSRGYKRKTEGFQLADENATAETIGDEPFQFYHKFKNEINVAVDSNRVNGIGQLLKLKHLPEVVLLDDAFQHRKVKAGFNIMLTTYNNPYFKDTVLPTGNLREPRSGAKRAHIIVVTKCPKHMSYYEKVGFLRRINATNDQQVFFSSISYADEVISENAALQLNELKDFALVTGIANASPLIKFLKNKNLKFEHSNFKDHHEFSANDISALESKKLIITTEKDFMRLKQYKSLKDKLFYLPITVSISDGNKFNEAILNFMKSY
ncbi:tetraacyldisaccharide 4'-kinase [Algibacter sp. 2305UL17-15]|uniref:tetraacyldisaccharide 4'-kinase n=1 Tax=Algibacter sp. 2305UL17-15 TaxID=3231268 RepID=UPI00345A8B10